MFNNFIDKGQNFHVNHAPTPIIKNFKMNYKR
jgi:hypothetical protein